MSKFHEKTFFKNVRKSWAKATRRSSEFAINMNKKLSPTGLTRAQLRDLRRFVNIVVGFARAF